MTPGLPRECYNPSRNKFSYALGTDLGLYSRILFPRIVNWCLSDREVTKIRRELLAGVSGNVFELGFGTGLNLPYYPDHVTKLITADPNPAMKAAAQERIAHSPIDVDCRVLGGESLPFDDASFDAVVCTWTLCSIPDPGPVLAQCHRILRPGGRFFFVEHGLADDEGVRRWQARINPFWRIAGDGCNLNRNIAELIQDSHFRLATLDNYYMVGSPRFLGYMYQGVAVRD